MASVPGKAEKWFNETRKHLKHSFKGRHVKKAQYEEGMEIHTCTYCPKAFSDTRCLVMHVLRRHSDNLVLLYKNVLDCKNSEKSDLLPSDIIKCIQTEFSDLKNELCSVKEIVLEFLSSNPKSQVPQLSPCTSDLKSHSLSKLADTTHNVSSENEKAGKKCCEKNISDIDSKLHDLFETYKNDVILKDIKSEIAVNKKEMIEEVKCSLQLEIKNIVLHMDKSISELKKSDSDLKKELISLSKLVKSNCEKINSLDTSPDIEERLEQHLQSILNCSSLYDKKLKPKTPSQKQRKKRSIFTITSNTCRNSHLSHSQNEFPNPNKSLPKQPEVTIPSKLNAELTNETNKIKNIVDEKLKSYSINPSIEKLSTEEFQKKMCLLKTETEMLGNSIEGFTTVRDNLDLQVNKIARSYTKVNNPKKIRFSDSLQKSSPILNKESEVSILQNRSSEKEISNCMSPVEFAEDYLAQGDCPLLTNKCNQNSERRSSSKPDKDGEICVQSRFSNNESCRSKPYKEKRENTHKEVAKFNPISSHKIQRAPSCSGFMQNFEDLSELSSLSDLED